MAVYNEIGIGRWNRFIQKLTDMKGGPPARQLSSEIQFAHPFFHGVENRYLESWDRFGSVGVVPAAGAGNGGGLRLRNPVGSNVVAVVESLLCSPQAAALTDLFAVFLGPSTTDLPTIVGPSAGFFDPRGRKAATCIFSVTAAASPPALPSEIIQSGFLTSSAGFQFINNEDQEFPILPGMAMQIQNNTLNQSFVVSIITRERFLEPAERF